jgi:hypothetical protein
MNDLRAVLKFIRDHPWTTPEKISQRVEIPIEEVRLMFKRDLNLRKAKDDDGEVVYDLPVPPGSLSGLSSR